MQQTQQQLTSRQPKKPWFYILMGFLAGVVVMGCITTAVILWFVLVRPGTKTADVYEAPDASVTITVGSDGCGVERSEVIGESEVDAITWVILDEEGYSVLERAADGEYKYQYFRSGHYKVHLKAWYDGQYHQISNEVSIDC